MTFSSAAEIGVTRRFRSAFHFPKKSNFDFAGRCVI